jgi:hypothetical protein
VGLKAFPILHKINWSCRIIDSEIFTFVVGPNKKQFQIHSYAITRLSEMLRALVTNGMAESQQKLATLSDVEEEDFGRFFQFAYTGDYCTPSFVLEAVIPPQENMPQDSIFVHVVNKVVAPTKTPQKSKLAGGLPSATEEKPVKKEINQWGPVWASWGVDQSKINVSDRFETKKYCKVLPRQVLFGHCEPVRNTDPAQNFTPVFLAHARLYEFAERYMITSLKDLVLQKLKQTLSLFQIHPERVQDVTELVRFAYSEDRTSDTEELKVLVTFYVAAKYELFRKSEDFETLLQEGGPFVLYFFRLLQNRL